MLRSGLVNQHRARFEEGFPHERNNHPRDILIRPFVQTEIYPILKRGRYTEPELPVNDPNPVQPKYIDIFGKKTTPDERIYLYKEFFNAAKKFGFVPGQPVGPKNANGKPGQMLPTYPQPSPRDPQGGVPTEPNGNPQGGVIDAPPPLIAATNSSSGSVAGSNQGVDYTSELDAQVFIDRVSADTIFDTTLHDVDAMVLHQQGSRWGGATQALDEFYHDTTAAVGPVVGSSSQISTQAVTPAIEYPPVDVDTLGKVMAEKWRDGMVEDEIMRFVGERYGPQVQTSVEVASIKAKLTQGAINTDNRFETVNKIVNQIEKKIEQAEKVNKLGPAHNIRAKKIVNYNAPVTIIKKEKRKEKETSTEDSMSSSSFENSTDSDYKPSGKKPVVRRITDGTLRKGRKRK